MLEFVSVVKKHDPNSYNSIPRIVAICIDENASKRWIQDEVDGRHEDGHSYMTGKDAAWWIKNGYFTIHHVEVQS